MSNPLAIATVTATLQNLLQSELNNYFSSPTVNIGSPAQSSDETTTPEVNIFLYQVTPNSAFCNVNLPSRTADGQLIRRLQTALDLHYLLSFYGDESEIIPQRLLGYTVNSLHAVPILTPELILSTLNNPNYAYLQGSNLADQMELVKFSLMTHSMEDLAKLWSIFPRFDYVLSVAYLATVVIIEDDQIPTPPKTVFTGVQIDLNPFPSGPLNAAMGLQLSNILLLTDPSTGIQQLSANVLIERAYIENGIDDYILYWSADGISPLSGQAPLMAFPPTDANITYTLTGVTVVPNATYLLVLTSNRQGQMNHGPSMSFVENTLPQQTATQVSFADQDPQGTLISGPVTIYKANDESTIDIYALYWGTQPDPQNPPQKLTGYSSIAELPKTGENLTYTFPTGIPLPMDATYLLVFTRNTQGEMPIGINTPIADLATTPPIHMASGISFKGTIVNNVIQSGAAVTVNMAVDERDITDYMLYWGSDAATKLSGQVHIVDLPKTGADLVYTFSSDTPIPTGALFILVFTDNSYGEMTKCVSCSLQ